MIRSDCVQSGSALTDCVASSSSSSILNLTCSDLLLQPNISASSSMDGVSEAQRQGFQVFKGSNFTVSCSIQPQYPGGSFQLTFTSSNTARNYTRPAVTLPTSCFRLQSPPTKEATAVFLLVREPSAVSHCLRPAGGRSRAHRRTSSWIIITWVFLQLKEGRLKRKELREQSRTSKELIKHPDGFLS